MVRGPLRIAWFSDLARGRPESLSAYCSRLLLPELSKSHRIELFSDSFSSSEFGLPHYHYLNAYKRHRQEPFDLFFYQLEDSRACRFIRGHIGLMPGVVWVHDLFCKDLGPEACHTSPWEHTISQFYDSAQGFPDRSVAPHQLWPRVYREASLCPVVLFSSQWAHDEFSRMTSNRLEASMGAHRAEVVSIPIDSALVSSGYTGSAGGEVRIACADVPELEGRMHKVLPALCSLSSPWSLTWMLDREEIESARVLVREFGIKDEKVRFVSPRSPEAWAAVVRESDIATFLHVSTFGHLAPYVQISMALGCPTVVARAAQGEDLPGDVAFHIVPGMHEAAQFIAVVEAVKAGGVTVYGAPGRRYAQLVGDLTRVSMRLSDVLTSSAADLSTVMKRWKALEDRAQVALCEEVRGLVGSDSGSAGPSAFDEVIAPSMRELGWR